MIKLGWTIDLQPLNAHAICEKITLSPNSNKHTLSPIMKKKTPGRVATVYLSFRTINSSLPSQHHEAATNITLLLRDT